MTTGVVDWSHHASWSRDPANVQLARRFVSERLAEHGENDLLDAGRLVVTELATNAIRHARADVRVGLSRTDDQVLLRVHDGSPSRPRLRHTSPESDDGRGFATVERVTTGWGITDESDGGKRVWARFGGRQER